MARKLRLEYPGAIYHVVNRGNRRERIFLEDDEPLATGTRGHLNRLRYRQRQLGQE